jgi:small conductance mechanosensitive channel
MSAALLLLTVAFAQDSQTVADPEIDVAVLELRLRPMQLAQVEVEANAWLQLLADKNAAISRDAEAALRAVGEQKETLNNRIAAQAAEQTRLVDRLHVTLAALRARGGKIESYEQYVAASTGFQIGNDIESNWAFVRNWLTSPEGGIRVGLNIVKFLATLFAFVLLSGILAGIVRRALAGVKKTSNLLRDFFVNATRKVAMFIGIVVALSMLEVNIGPFLAAIGAAGFVIGFALQGTLSNFAAGIMILIYRPYDIGQGVILAGRTGKVDEMSLVSTTLRMPDNQLVVIPNSSIWGDVITNISGQTTRRVDLTFGVSYEDDLQKVQRVLEEVVKAHPKVLAEPAPVIKVHALADSSVNFIVRPWVATADYWDVFWDLTRAVKERFDQEDISIPFPQRVVHMRQAPTS